MAANGRGTQRQLPYSPLAEPAYSIKEGASTRLSLGMVIYKYPDMIHNSLLTVAPLILGQEHLLIHRLPC